MNYWIITDTHFGHHKMQDYCQRPDSFEETILKNLQHCVKLDDVLIHLGDICIHRDEDWLADETDVERYLESMREALLDEIRKGKRIQI